MDVREDLEHLVGLLEEEKQLLGKTLSDATYVETLENVMKAKRDLLERLAAMEPEALEPYAALVKQIRELGDINMQIAQSNMLFIEELFSSIFKDTTSQYDENGTVTSKKEGLINKKI